MLTKTAFILLALTSLASAQDHSFTPVDIEEGRRIYRSDCTGCHGGEGASVAGIDLVRAKYRLATSDEDLVKTILNGVPGTGMPASVMPHSRAPMILAYLRSLRDAKGQKSIAAPSGDPARGKLLFENKIGCAGCHRISNEGGRSGPDLSDIGHLLNPMEIETEILDPDAQYPFGSRPVRVVLKGGSALTGLLLNQDTYSVQLVDQEGSLRSLQRSELNRVQSATSWMPSYRGKVDAQELADLIAYLRRQKGTQ